MGVIIGTLSRSSYTGFLTLILINAVFIVLPIVIPRNSYLHYLPFHTPIMLWLNSRLWFTDGSFITLWRNFELWGLGISFLVLTALCLLAGKKFGKKDIA